MRFELGKEKKKSELSGKVWFYNITSVIYTLEHEATLKEIW